MKISQIYDNLIFSFLETFGAVAPYDTVPGLDN